MEQPVIMVAAGDGDPSAGGADFAAGVAAATAAQAAEVADAAAVDADIARDVASSASETAWDARSAVDLLADRQAAFEDRVIETLGEITDLLDAGGPIEELIDDGAPDVVAPTKPEPEHSPPPKRERGFGSDWWFGSRR